MKVTYQEVADKLDISYEIAAGLMRFLCEDKIALAVKVGERKQPGTKGKGQGVFEFVEDFDRKLCEVLQKLG